MPVPTLAPEILAIRRDVEQLRHELRSELLTFSIQLQDIQARMAATSTCEIDACKTDQNLLIDMVKSGGDEAQSPPLECQEGEVHFGESAWSFPMILGLTTASSWDIIFAILLLLLNFGMQVMFSYIIMGPSFSGSDFEGEVLSAQRWRARIAHDYKYMDLKQTSLATRVCSADGALILSTVQATLVNQINSFMGMDTEQFEPGLIQPGILLCSLCILLWSLCIYKEFRHIILSVEAIWSIPRARVTEYRDNTIYSLSRIRCIAMLAAYFTRTTIATVLLVAGIRWLARTTSITDLILNAVALNAILDVDEWLFAAFTPISIELAVKTLQPVKVTYSTRRSQLEAVFLFALLFATLLVPYLVLLQPLGATMAAVKWELCGGNQTFVLAQNAQTQVVTGLATTRGAQEMSVVERAVKRHIFNQQETPYYISFQPGPTQFDAQRTADMQADQEQWTACVETDFMHPDGFLYQDALMESLVSPRLHTAAAMLGVFEDVSNCSDLKDLCDLPEARLLRMVCGSTCGCTDPLSQPFHKVVRGGCTDSCLKLGEQALENVECKDQPAGERWRIFWDTYPHALSDFFGNNMSGTVVYPQILSLVAEMKVRGCSGLQDPTLQLEITSSTPWCEGFSPLFRPLAWLCPESCGCKNATRQSCPSSCTSL